LISGISQPPWAHIKAHIPEIKSQKEKWENIVLQARAAVEWTKSPDSYMNPAAEVLCLVSCLISYIWSNLDMPTYSSLDGDQRISCNAR
jgi:hypothetical protein